MKKVLYLIFYSLLINNYCSNQEHLVCDKDCNTNKKTVLDIGCGRGGDLLKFISADVGFVIGIDKDITGLDSLNGVKDRYHKLKNKLENVPEMEFIHGDFTQNFTVKEQNKSTNSTSKDNDRLIRKYLNKYKTKFDVLNIQFVFHYLFNSEPEFNSVCNNINNILNVGGYILMTCFDGDTIKNLLDKNNIHILNRDGEWIFFDDKGKIVKKEIYSKGQLFKTIPEKEIEQFKYSIKYNDGVYEEK